MITKNIILIISVCFVHTNIIWGLSPLQIGQLEKAVRDELTKYVPDFTAVQKNIQRLKARQRTMLATQLELEMCKKQQTVAQINLTQEIETLTQEKKSISQEVIQTKNILAKKQAEKEKYTQELQDMQKQNKLLQTQQEKLITNQKQQLLQQQKDINSLTQQITQNRTALTKKDQEITNLQKLNAELQAQHQKDFTALQGKQKESSADLRAENKQLQEQHAQEKQQLQEQLTNLDQQHKQTLAQLQTEHTKVQKELNAKIQDLEQELETYKSDDWPLDPSPFEVGEIPDVTATMKQEILKTREELEDRPIEESPFTEHKLPDVLEEQEEKQLLTKQMHSLYAINKELIQMKNEITLLHNALKALHDQVLTAAGQDENKAQTLKVRFDDHGSNIMRYYDMINGIQINFNKILDQLEKLTQSVTTSMEDLD